MCYRRGFCLIAAILGSSLLPTSVVAQSDNSSQTVDQLSKRLDELRTEMNKIEAQLSELKSAKGNPPSTATQPPSPAVASAQQGTIETTQPLPQGPTSKQVGEATATYNTFSEDTQAAARFNNIPLDPKYQGFFSIPGTQDILKIGGYFKTDFIYDLKPAGNPDAFVPSSIPIPTVVGVSNANCFDPPHSPQLRFSHSLHPGC